MGLFWGATHDNCNHKYQIRDQILIVFLNLSGYHTHLSIKNLEETSSKDNIEIIAGNKEKYISFNAKIKVKLARFTNKDVKEAC